MKSIAYMTKKMHDASDLLNSLGLLERYINNSFLKVNKEFNSVALKSDSTYADIFLAGLQEQYFNFILEDHSYFQFNYTPNDTEPFADKAKARYAFYPNPFKTEDDDLEMLSLDLKEGAISFEEYSQAISEYRPNVVKPPVRYDLSFSQYKQILHPTAHFHFGISENTRIGTDSIISPLLFVMFIIKTFYSDYWGIVSDSTNGFELDISMVAEKANSIKIEDLDSASFYCAIQKQLMNID